MTTIAFIIILALIITAHELGHFLAAKKSGVLVEEFNIGFPPRLWQKRWGETLYRLNLIPIGGYVKLFGEEETAVKEAPHLLKRAFFRQPALRRLFIVSAGVLMNLLVSLAIFALVYSFSGIPWEINWTRIVAVVPNSPAAAAGLQAGETIVALNGHLVHRPEEVTQEVNHFRGQWLKLTLAGGQTARGLPVACPPQLTSQHCFQLAIKPRRRPPPGQGALGIVISNQVVVKPVWWQRPWLGIWAGLRESVFWGREILLGLGQLGRNLLKGQVPADVAGPLGVYRVSRQVQRQAGWLAFLHFFGILSLNLAIINILPLPALDGGQAVFILAEIVSRRRLNPRFKMLVNQLGLFLLLLLLLLLTFHDAYNWRQPF